MSRLVPGATVSGAAGSHLKLLPTRGAQEVLAVRVPKHVQTQLVGTAEGLVALRALVDLF